MKTPTHFSSSPDFEKLSSFPEIWLEILESSSYHDQLSCYNLIFARTVFVLLSRSTLWKFSSSPGMMFRLFVVAFLLIHVGLKASSTGW